VQRIAINSECRGTPIYVTYVRKASVIVTLSVTQVSSNTRLWHLLPIIIFNFLIYIFILSFIFIPCLAFYIEYGNLPIILQFDSTDPL
jgi:hypothetical protein